MQAPSAPTSDHLAQKEFLEQTPWANPQHPVHRTPSAFAPYNLATQSSHQPVMNMLRNPSMHPHRTSSPYSTPVLGSQRRMDYHMNGLGSSETVGISSDPPSGHAPAPTTGDRAQLAPFDRAGDESPIGQVKRARGTSRVDGKRNFSGLSSASTIETPSDPITAADDHRSHASAGLGMMHHSLPMDSSSTHQSFATSALYAQHGDERMPEVYESASYRPRMGAFGTPLPLGGVALPPTVGREGRQSAQG